MYIFADALGGQERVIDPLGLECRQPWAALEGARKYIQVFQKNSRQS